jgi:nucleoside-diphosphate-sugar epimerase
MAKIYVAGHRGMVGGAIVRALQSQGDNKLVARKAGGRTLIEAASLHSYLNGLPRLHGGGAA